MYEPVKNSADIRLTITGGDSSNDSSDSDDEETTSNDKDSRKIDESLPRINRGIFHSIRDAAPLTAENRTKQKLNAKLLTAIERGDAATFASCIDEGAELNATCRGTGLTSCHLASLYGRDDMLGTLLSRGGDSARYSWYNGTLPLHLACWSGSVNCLQMLLNCNPNTINDPIRKPFVAKEIEVTLLDSRIHCCDEVADAVPILPSGSTALHVACRNLKTECVLLLLKNGADVQLADDRNLTAVDVINENYDFDIDENLRKNTSRKSMKRKSAAISSTDGNRTSASSVTSCLSVDTFVLGRSTEEVDSITSRHSRTLKEDVVSRDDDNNNNNNNLRIDFSCAESFDGDITDRSYLTAQTKVCKYKGDVIRVIVESLIEHGANFKSGCARTVQDVGDSIVENNAVSNTLLHKAVIVQDAKLIEQLLQNGFNVLVRNDDGETPLDLAIKRKLPLALEILLKSVRDLKPVLESVDRGSGITALHSAICGSWLFGVSILLEAGANVFENGKNGNSVLHYAAQTGNAIILEELLTVPGIIQIVDCTNSMGETALMVAVQYGNAECVQTLLDFGVNDRISLSNCITVAHVAAEKGYLEILKMILQYDPDLKGAKTNEGLTVLHLVSIKGHLSCLKYLLTIDCDELAKTATTYFGGTPLHFAARNGHLKAVQCLIKHNKELVHTANIDGWYALHIAAAFGHKHCVRHLIGYNGDLSLTVTDREGNKKTAVDIISYTIPDPAEFFEDILDSGIEVNSMPLNHRRCVITFNYAMLMPSGERKKQMNVLNAFLNTQNVALQQTLFLHPLVQTFLYLKWRKLRLFFFISVLLYLLFTLSVTAFAFDVYVWKSQIVKLLSSCVMVPTLLLLSLQEILHASKLQRYYITDVESLLKWSTFFITLVTGICGFTNSLCLSSFDSGDGSLLKQCKSSFLCQDITAVAVLLSWIELLFLLSRFPGWGFYVLMFFRVASRILKVFSTFTCLMVGFMLSFYILFSRTSPFPSFWSAFVKIIVMTSELDYANVFEHVEDGSSTAYVGRLIFLAFVLLVGIVLMNLMIGLAVSDIALLETEGKSQTSAKQIDFLKMLEMFVYQKKFVVFLPRTMRKRIKSYHLVPSVFKYYPGRPMSSAAKKLPTKLRNSILDKAFKMQSSRKADTVQCRDCKENKNLTGSSSPSLKYSATEADRIL